MFNKSCAIGNALLLAIIVWRFYHGKIGSPPTNPGKNAYKIGIITIIVRYGGKVLFSGVFAVSRNSHDRGMVLDEKGRNG